MVWILLYKYFPMDCVGFFNITEASQNAVGRCQRQEVLPRNTE